MSSESLLKLAGLRKASSISLDGLERGCMFHLVMLLVAGAMLK